MQIGSMENRRFTYVRRILHLITRFLDGGAERVAENQMQGLIDSGEAYDVRLGFGAEYDSERAKSLQELGIETHCFNHIRHYSLLHTIPAVIQVARYLRANQIDLIHTHGTEAGMIGRWAGVLAQTPVTIHEIHGDPITVDRSSLLNLFVWLMELFSAPLATKIIVGSEQIRETFLERGIGTKAQYELIYDGIDITRFEDSQPSNLPMSDANLRLVFVGRLHSGKGLFDLIQAFNRLHTTDVDLLIAGRGPIEDELDEAIRQLGLDESVHRLGYRDDIPGILAASDVLVLPSYREGTPRVISEALASGTPVVSTNIAGIPEQVQEGKYGLLVQPGDIDALVDSLEKLLSSEELREEMSQACRSHVEQFGMKYEQEAVAKLYNRLLSQKNS